MSVARHLLLCQKVGCKDEYDILGVFPNIDAREQAMKSWLNANPKAILYFASVDAELSIVQVVHHRPLGDAV